MCVNRNERRIGDGAAGCQEQSRAPARGKTPAHRLYRGDRRPSLDRARRETAADAVAFSEKRGIRPNLAYP